MSNKERLETLWESHNFYLQRADALEGEYSFLSERSREFFAQPVIEAFRKMDADPQFRKTLPVEMVEEVEELLKDYDDTAVPVDKACLLRQLRTISTDLREFYKKQLHALKEIKHFYRDYPYDIPERHEISSPELLGSLEKSTLKLLKVHGEHHRALCQEIKKY